MQQTIFSSYQHLVSHNTEKITEIKAKVDRLSFVRVALLVVEVLLFISFVKATDEFAILISGVFMLIPIAVFVMVVKKQNRLSKYEAYLKNLLWIYQNEVNLIIGNENGYDHGTAFEDEAHHYLSDLDIFGKSSLFSLTNRCSTTHGQQQLAGHLTAPNNKEGIVLRQEAIKEITNHIKDTFSFRAILKGNNVNNIDRIKAKLNTQLAEQLKFTHQSFLRFYVKLLPIIMPILFLLAIIIGGKLWGVISIIALLHAGLTFFYMKKINQIYFGFGGSASLLADYADAIKWTEDRDWQSPYIQRLFSSKEKVSDQIKKLSKIIQAFDARLNIIVGAVLNFCLLWDLKCCIRLDEWHQTSSMDVENGLDRIGYFEELISFSTLSYNHPSWVFPKIEAQFSLKTVAMGHPLIPKSKRITNDFAVEENPTVDVVTGSNMAGKSTFLRTLAINMVLAYAGAPVSADQMNLSIFRILTYMRIKDSLNESTSTFKAELNRLKMILANVATHQNSFVLIDEMLRGTNSKDKFLGSKVFIEKLISMGTPTLFATHDLQLSELKEIHPATLRNFHFDIQINKGEMEFDYKIKSGPCKTFNAAILLNEIGLTIE